ncbi:Cytochrome b561 domain-containing protein [Mycena venus]|uniref:Cytochrome b561 domain-containing protein n=1 Tax=Mycena venus TaxID=2733690 RepID=A0A8H6XDC4_9AGAR|nr:Cytochrome b561 domain-containing protein [Mycena venus]
MTILLTRLSVSCSFVGPRYQSFARIYKTEPIELGKFPPSTQDNVIKAESLAVFACFGPAPRIMLPLRLSGLLLLLWLQGLAVIGATSVGDNGCNLFFCLNITITDNEIMTYQVTPVFEPFGWVGLGFGRMMKDTHMVVIWEKEDGSKIVSQRYGVGHVEPVIEPKPPRMVTVVPPTVKETLAHTHTNYSTTAFQIPFNKTDPRPGQIIWAYSLRRPDDDPSSDLTGHYVAGTVNMRLNKGVPDLPGMVAEGPEDALAALPRYQKLIWHGILLSVGFLVLLPTGSLVARWGRTFTPRWFMVHRIVNFYVALPVIAAGFILGPLAVLDRQAKHFADAHQICGVLLVAVYLAQLFLGRYIHSRRAVEGRQPHPPSNIMHAVLGISIIALAFLQVRSGFGEWSKRTGQQDVSRWCHDALAAWSLILPALYFGGLAFLKRQFVQEQKGETYDASPEGKNYIALAAAPSPILFDSEHEADLGAYSELESGVPLLHRAS